MPVRRDTLAHGHAHDGTHSGGAKSNATSHAEPYAVADAVADGRSWRTHGVPGAQPDAETDAEPFVAEPDAVADGRSRRSDGESRPAPDVDADCRTCCRDDGEPIVRLAFLRSRRRVPERKPGAISHEFSAGSRRRAVADLVENHSFAASTHVMSSDSSNNEQRP